MNVERGFSSWSKFTFTTFKKLSQVLLSLCLVKISKHLAIKSQKSQLNHKPSCLAILCFFKVYLFEVWKSHCLHMILILSFMIVLKCGFIIEDLFDLCWHLLQLWDCPKWTKSTCVFKLSFLSKDSWQMVQLKVRISRTVAICQVDLLSHHKKQD